MIKTIKNLSYIAFVIILIGCSGSKKMLKKGIELEHAKQYREASNFYMHALDRKNTNVDALISLNRVGTKVLESYLSQFYKDEAMGETKKAVYSYLKANAYKDRLIKYKIDAKISEHYSDKYGKVKNTYILNQYESANKHLDNGEYKQAEQNFTEVLKFDSNYKDAKELKNIAIAEPKFILAEKQLDEKKYRDAYANYNIVLKTIPNYKDAKESKALALELGRHNFLIFPFENSTNKHHLESKISSYVTNNLSNINDPFLRLVDRMNLNKIMKEQELGLSGLVDESSATEIGRILGAKTAVAGKVISFSSKKSDLKIMTKEAFEAYFVEKTNHETKKIYKEKRYRKINYREYTKTIDVIVGFQFKIISLKTSEVLNSEIIELSSKDKVQFSRYKADTKTLYPISYSKVNTNYSAVSKFRKQFSTRSELKNEDELVNKLCKDISSKVSKNIKIYLD